MNIPCPVCVRCVDPSEPTANYSTEDADVDHVFCYGSANGGNLPGAGRNWRVGDCMITWGPVSCFDIDSEGCQTCIEESFWICNPPGSPPSPFAEPDLFSSSIEEPPPPGSPPGAPNQPRQIFWNLGQSCSVDCPDGTQNTFTVPPFRFADWTQEGADRKATSYCNRHVRDIQICLSDLPDFCCATQSGLFGTVVVERGHFGPYTLSVIGGNLPTGLDLINVEGGFSADLIGEARTAGVFTFTIRATNELGHSHDRQYTVDVFGIENPEDIPDAKCDNPYSFQLTTAGGHGAITFELDPATALPGGLTLSSGGLISGTPNTDPISAFFRVRIKDSSVDDNGNPDPRECTIGLTMTVSGPRFLNAPVNGDECTTYGPLQILTSPTPCVFTGQCPGSLIISSSGIISGKPHVRGDNTFLLSATDSQGNTNTQTTVRNFTSSGGNAKSIAGMVWTGEFTTIGNCNFTATHFGGTVRYEIDMPTAADGRIISTVSFPRSALSRCIGDPGYDIRVVASWVVTGTAGAAQIIQNQVDVAGQFIFSTPSNPAASGSHDIILPAAGWPAAGGQTDFQFNARNFASGTLHISYRIDMTPIYPP